MFGLFGKKSYPLLKPEMIEPVDQPLSTTDAKKIFKAYMREIGYLDKDELSEHAGYLGEEIRDMEQAHREDIRDSKEVIREAKRRIKSFNKKLISCTSEEKREEFEVEIHDAEGEIEWELKQIEKSTKELEDLKKDKRPFLVDYVNSQLSDSK